MEFESVGFFSEGVGEVVEGGDTSDVFVAEGAQKLEDSGCSLPLLFVLGPGFKQDDRIVGLDGLGCSFENGEFGTFYINFQNV